jgi:hypothetical protein
MVLMAIIGGLGAGKTLCLTYLAWRNYRKGLKIFSNYHLAIPHNPVNTVNDILDMKKGFFAGDELWSWIDARASMSKKNKIVGNFLLTSRKRDVNFAFTTQTFNQVDIRIRRVCDFIAIPQLSVDEKIARMMVFSYPSLQLIKVYKFRSPAIWDLYNTNEVVQALPDMDDTGDMDYLERVRMQQALEVAKRKGVPSVTYESGADDLEDGDEDDDFGDEDETRTNS